MNRQPAPQSHRAWGLCPPRSRTPKEGIDYAHAVVCRRPEDEVFLRLDKISHVISTGAEVALRVAVEPFEDRLAQFRRVAMRREILHQLRYLWNPERLVEVSNAVEHIAEGLRPPEDILGARGDQERARCDERAQVGRTPAVGVDPERAIAVAIHSAVAHQMLDAPRLADRNHHANTLVGGAQEPRDRAAAAQESPPCALDPRQCGWRGSPRRACHSTPRCPRALAPAIPVPASAVVGAVVHPLRLAELDWVEHEGNVAVLAEPTGVGLIGGVHLPLGVPA